MPEESGESAAVATDGVAGARRRADGAGTRTAYGRDRLREMDDAHGRAAGSAEPALGPTPGYDWTAQARSQAARMHDSAAALHDHAVALGIGDEHEHRRQAQRHRAAAQSNRPAAEPPQPG